MINKRLLIYGDVFIDYISKNIRNNDFLPYLGGATVNVAAGAARLGAQVSFITVIGVDKMSKFAHRELEKEGIDLTPTIINPDKRVSGVYIHLTDRHERVFAKYENETPEIQVKEDNICKEIVEEAAIIHICSGTMFHPTALATTKRMVHLAKNSGALISFDANIRPLRWESEKDCRETTTSFLYKADVVKLTEEELTFMMAVETVEEGLEKLKSYSIPVVLLTKGELGTQAIIHDESIFVPVEKVVPIDTTGAGDAFMAGVLSKILENGFPISLEEWREFVLFGNRLGALCVTKPGAISAMPYASELEDMDN